MHYTTWKTLPTKKISLDWSGLPKTNAQTVCPSFSPSVSLLTAPAARSVIKVHINKNTNISRKIGSDQKMLSSVQTKSQRGRYIFPLHTVSSRTTLPFLNARSLPPHSNHSERSTGKNAWEHVVCVRLWHNPHAHTHTVETPTLKRSFLRVCKYMQIEEGGRVQAAQWSSSLSKK